jgi:tetratricopeptide (TPR) repeat protein
MIATPTLINAHYRLASYYLTKLRNLEFAYQSGYEHSAFALHQFDQEWSQIKHWGDWAVKHAHEDERVAALCKDYSEAGINLLHLRFRAEDRLEWLNAGVNAAQQLGDPYAEMANEYLIARACNSLGSFALAQGHAEKAVTLAQRIDNHHYESKILISLGNALASQDEYEQARIIYKQALELSSQLDSKILIGSALNGLGNIAFDQSDFERAADYYSQFLEISEQYGRPHEIALALRNLATIKHTLGDSQTTIRYAEQCVELCRATGDDHQLASVLSVLGDVAINEGKLGEAYEYYHESLELTIRSNRPSDEARAWGNLGNLHVQRRDFPAALTCFEAVLGLSEKSGFRFYRALALMQIAQVFRMMGDLPSAMQNLRSGLEIVLTLQSTTLRIYYLLESTLLWSDRGLEAEAAPWMGLLQENVKELDAEQKAAFDEVHLRLERALGYEPLCRAIDDGKTLDLNHVMEAILEALDTR